MSGFRDKLRTPFTWLFGALVVLSFLTFFAGQLQTLDAAFTGKSNGEGQSLGLEIPLSSTLNRFTVTQLEPQGGAAEAGLRIGDTVQFETLADLLIPAKPGDKIPVTVERGDQRFETTIVAQAPQPRSLADMIGMATFAAFGLATLAFGALLVLRGRGNRHATFLGLMLIAIIQAYPVSWLPRATVVPVVLVTSVSMDMVMGYVWPIFCMEISGGQSSPRQVKIVYGIALAFTVALLIQGIVPGLSLSVFAVIVLVHQLVGYTIVAINYRKNEAAARNRIKLVVIAFVCFMLLIVGENLVTFASPSVEFAALLLGISALALLAYAILKQRLFDLNFAINRTLVYGSVSFVLLASFGLAEWGVDHVIPESWHEGSLAISAGIAVALFLSFHRLRDWMEHHIERLFFSSWQRAEASLKRFVESAGHFDRIEVLCKSFAEALSHFAGGAHVALYLRESGGNYRRETGSLAGNAGYTDDPAFALMRAERRPIELAQTDSTLPGELALPMLDQGVLVGFVLLAGKPDGVHYRPDEIANLGWAAHQVGLDLQALHARELEAEVSLLRHDKQELLAILGELKLAKGKS